MKRFFFLLLITSRIFSFEESDDSDETSEKDENYHFDFSNVPSSIVGGVNVITGRKAESHTDLVVKANVPLVLNRDDQICKHITLTDSYQWSAFSSACFSRGKRKSEVNVITNGDYLTYPHFKDNTFKFSGGFGAVNISQLRYGGQPNILENRCEYVFYKLPDGSKKAAGVLKSGDGSAKIYSKKFIDPVKVNEKKKDEPEMEFTFFLDHEILPSGHSLTYGYDDKNFMNRYALKNPAQEEVASIVLNANENTYEFTSSDGKKLVYHLNKDHKITSITRPDGTQETISDKEIRGIRHMRHNFPEGRYVETNFYSKGFNPITGRPKQLELKWPDSRIGAVNNISGPLGVNGEQGTLWTFEYKLRKHHRSICETTVKDANLNITKYNVKDGRIETIKKYENPNSVWSEEIFDWGDKGKKVSTVNLVRRRLKDREGNYVFCKKYIYDANQNIIEERLYGNFTGKYTGSVYDDRAKTYDKNAEIRIKKSEYDSENRLVKQWEGESTSQFTYYPDSWQTASRITTMSDGYTFRNFYEYDGSGSVSLEISDDGFSEDRNDLSGVTCRTYIRYVNNAAGFPLVKETGYIDERGAECSLGKETYEYDASQNATKKELFDELGSKVYEERWAYDIMGRMTHKWDRCGYETQMSYDQNGNLISEQNFGSGITLLYTYNFWNHMTKKEAVFGDIRLVERYGYNNKGEKIWSYDPFGNQIRYTYTPIGHLQNTKYAPLLCEDGSEKSINYGRGTDVLGRVCVTIDPNGAAVRKSFTLDNQPYRIQQHDNLIENLEYNLHGHLIKKTHHTGYYTTYDVDSLGRTLKESFYSPDDELQWEKSSAYSAYFILSQTDEWGSETIYEYDRAGRKIAEIKDGETITYEYDSQGRLSAQQNRILRTVRQYDVYDRITVEKIFDQSGALIHHIESVYDNQGRVIQKKTHTDHGIALEETFYNVKGDVVCSIDAEGNATRTDYDYTFINAQGKRVLQTKITDPLGSVLKTTFNIQGKAALIERFDPYGILTKKTECFYDLNGLKIKENEFVICDQKEVEKIETVWEYDWLKRVQTLVEANGTPEAKRFSYGYRTGRLLEREVKPDGTAIEYGYDAKGRMTSCQSDDGTIHYEYTFDNHDNIIEVADRVNQLVTKRFYTKGNLLEKEILGSGLTMEYTYDSLQRLTKTTLPDGSGIGYLYKGSQIYSVMRLDAENVKKYEHIYNLFDLSGKLLESHLIGNAGTLSYEFDKNLRVTRISHTLFNETLGYDDAGQLIRQTVNDETVRFTYDDLGQLTSENDNSYAYDSIYNMTKKNGETYEYNSLNQRIDNSTEYDRNGNVMWSGENTLAYDALDRLIRYNETSYVYDSFNRRISKTHEGKTTYYIYHEENEIGSTNSGFEIEELRLLGISQGAEIGAAVAFEFQGNAYAPIHDHNGNVSALIDASLGSLEASYKYSAFGECETLPSLNPWRFSSKRYDPESGLIYYGRRYYDPAAHRWLTPDPLSFNGGPNLYAFLLNNPLTCIDLYGLYCNETPLRQRGLVEAISHVVGEYMEWFMYNAIPVPFLKDIMMIPGHYLQGGSMSNYQFAHKRNPSRFGFHKGETPLGHGGVCHGLGNGIGTTEEEFMKNVEKYSKKMKNASLFYVYNGTNGIVADLLECALEKIGIGCKPDRLFVHELEKLDNTFKSEGKIMNYTFMTHSQGGLILKHSAGFMSRDLRGRMDVATIGSASIIPNGMFRSAVNYVSGRDLVYFTDPLGALKGLLGYNTNMVILRPRNYYPIDHAFNGATYEYAQDEIVKRFSKN